MPYGCGEQNMLNFVPDIIILDYLKSASKSTPQIEAKAIAYMEAGYQRQLTYKRIDGSYSAFGNSDTNGSTWLTAFVARSFAQGSKYITVDENSITQALSYLETVQNDDGSFTEYGVVHHKAMQGGSSQGTGLTAYVLITFLENKALSDSYSKVIDKAIDNIVSHLKDIDDVYTMAIVSYALYLAEKPSIANSLIQELDKKANNSDGTRHWDRKSDEYYISSLSTETSAYALLAYIEAFRDTDALLIARWLVSQRNSFGGFESTQDTVVGLLALSKIAAKITSKSLNMKVDVKYLNTLKSVNIAQNNALVLQKVEISSTAKVVEIYATGSGFALGQISYHYNVNELKKVKAFILTATVDSKSINSFNLKICVRLNGMNRTNMAVIEISAPSGYIFESENRDAIISSSKTIKVFNT